MTEKAIFTARAVVYYFDSTKKSWVPTPVGQEFCRADMYENTANNTFRVIGRALKDTTKVVINSNVTKDTSYTRASENFHQWSDNRYIYGLNFGSKEEAESFGAGFENVVNRLKGASGASVGGSSVGTMAQPPVNQAPVLAPKAPEPPKVVEPPKAPEPPKVVEPPKAPEPPKVVEPPKAPEPPSLTDSGGAPPPPGPPPPVKSSSDPSRGALLSSITGFNKGGLKKADTVDKSSPTLAKEDKKPSVGGGPVGLAEALRVRNQKNTTPTSPALIPKKTAPMPSPISPSGKAVGEPFKSTSGPKKTTSPPVSNSPRPATEYSSSELAALKDDILSEMRAELQQMKEEILAAIQQGR